MWNRKPCSVGAKDAPDDWLILCLGYECGRVYLTPVASPHQLTAWRWSAWSMPGAQGEAPTLEDACNEVRRTIVAAGGRMSGARLDVPI